MYNSTLFCPYRAVLYIARNRMLSKNQNPRKSIFSEDVLYALKSKLQTEVLSLLSGHIRCRNPRVNPQELILYFFWRFCETCVCAFVQRTWTSWWQTRRRLNAVSSLWSTKRCAMYGQNCLKLGRQLSFRNYFNSCQLSRGSSQRQWQQNRYVSGIHLLNL